MAKNIIPERGCRLEDLLDKLESEERQEQLARRLPESRGKELLEAVNTAIALAKRQKNLGICLTADQAANFQDRFDHPPFVGSSIDSRAIEMKEYLRDLISDIQACRLDCRDCLTSPDHCLSRDPNFPVKEARERHEQMNTWWINCTADNSNNDKIRLMIIQAKGDVERFKQLYREEFDFAGEPSIVSTFQRLREPGDGFDDVKFEYLRIGNTLEKKEAEQMKIYWIRRHGNERNDGIIEELIVAAKGSVALFERLYEAKFSRGPELVNTFDEPESEYLAINRGHSGQ